MHVGKYPEHIVIAGGGRWARVLVSVLCEMLPDSSVITIYSPHCAGVMADWAGSQGFKQNVSASYDWPDLSSGLSHAMIVANAARDHFSVAKRALENRIPVLVEKPVTLTYSDTQTLVQISRQNETLFATAHVFLFARFIDKFSGFVAKSGAVTSIRIRWSDPKAEERYGEKKSFDPSLPIYVDLIPHALSVISMFAPFRSCDYRGAVLERGGSSLAVSLKLGEVFCEIELLRNGDKRERIVELESDGGSFRLDFSVEPGVAFCGSTRLPETLLSAQREGGRPGPVLRMLNAFLQCAAGGERYDGRLGVNLGLEAAWLSDQMADDYEKQQKKWLCSALSSSEGRNEDIRYALIEILQLSGIHSSELIEVMSKSVAEVLTGMDRAAWLEKLEKSGDYRALIGSIAEAS